MLTQRTVSEVPEPGDQFGARLAVLHRADPPSDARITGPEVLIGSPREDVAGRPDTGLVTVWSRTMELRNGTYVEAGGFSSQGFSGGPRAGLGYGNVLPSSDTLVTYY